MNKFTLLPVVGVGFLTLTAESCSTQTGVPASSSQAASDSASASAAAQRQNAAVGQAIHITDSGGVTVDVTLEGVTFATTGNGAIAQPAQNGQYAVADVLVQDNAGQYSFNPLYFKYQTSDGTTYDSFSGNSLTAGFDPTLSSGVLNPGQKTRGNVVFDVKAKGGLVQVTDPLGQVVGQWTVPAS